MKIEFGRVLRELRKWKGLSQQQVADQLGIAKPNISRYENGVQLPDLEKLEPLSEILGVAPSEFLTYVERGNVSDGPDIQGTVPLLSWVQAGGWRQIVDNNHLETERVPTTYKPKKYTFALRVQGDSMEPKFPDGCLIIVEPEENITNGAYVVVSRSNEEATFKQLINDGGKVFLKPINPRYPILEVSDDTRICGVVKRIEMDV